MQQGWATARALLKMTSGGMCLLLVHEHGRVLVATYALEQRYR